MSVQRTKEWNGKILLYQVDKIVECNLLASGRRRRGCCKSGEKSGSLAAARADAVNTILHAIQ